VARSALIHCRQSASPPEESVNQGLAHSDHVVFVSLYSSTQFTCWPVSWLKLFRALRLPAV
jgi:hypothetical protein